MYQSPFSPNEIKYFMSLMMNDATKGKGATYAKLEVLLSNTKDAERFTHLRDNKQYQDADAIAQEYICNGEVENDNYQWLYVNYQFEAN